MFVDAPLGHTAGAPRDAPMQREIVESALHAAMEMTEPGTIVDLPLRWHHEEWRADPWGWTRRREDGADGGFASPAGDTRTPRSTSPRYQSEEDRLAAESTDWDVMCTTCLGLPPESERVT